jgi:hypothetical protein
MIFGPLIILARTTADQQTLRTELISGSDKQVADSLHHTSMEVVGNGVSGIGSKSEGTGSKGESVKGNGDKKSTGNPPSFSPDGPKPVTGSYEPKLDSTARDDQPGAPSSILTKAWKDVAANKVSVVAEWARMAGTVAGESETMAAEVANAVLPSGRILRLVGAVFVGVATGAGVLLCAYDALGSGAAAAASAVAAAGTIGLEQGRAVHAESERNRVARALPAVTALVTAHHAAAASGSETVAVVPGTSQALEAAIQRSEGKYLAILERLRAQVVQMHDEAKYGTFLERGMSELKELLNKELVTVQGIEKLVKEKSSGICALVEALEARGAEKAEGIEKLVEEKSAGINAFVEAHGVKKAEAIEKLIEEKSARIITSVIDKLGAAEIKLDTVGPTVKDAIIEMVRSELHGIRAEAAISWTSIVQVLEQIQQIRDAAAAVPPRDSSQLEAAVKSTLDNVTFMHDEAKLPESEQAERKRSALLLSTYLWRKIRKRLAIERYYETLAEYETEPTTETIKRLEHQLGRIYTIKLTTPTHDAQTGGKLEMPERIRMWKISKLALVRHIATKDRKGPPPNPNIPEEVTEDNMMCVIRQMNLGPQVRANHSLGLDTFGKDFELAMKAVAVLCKDNDVELDADGLTRETINGVIDRLPEDLQERVIQILTGTRIHGASLRVTIREKITEETVALKKIKSVSFESRSI